MNETTGAPPKTEKPVEKPQREPPGLVQELDKVAELPGWAVLVRFGLDKLLAEDPALLLDLLVRRAYRDPPDPALANRTHGERLAALLTMFELKLSLTRKRDRGGT